MKWFYITALAVTVIMVLSPLLFLPARTDTGYEGLVVRYSSYGSAVKSLDPATCGDTTSSAFQSDVYEGLYTYHYLKRPLEVVPQLAAEMPKISPDRLTYTIRIKSGVKYSRNPCFGKDSDGRNKSRSVRAGDFVLAFKRVADYHIQTGLAWSFISERIIGLDQWRKKSKKFKLGDFSRYDIPVEGVKALDELTLQIRLKEPYPQLIYALAMHVYAPVPPEAVDYWLAGEDGPGGREPVPMDQRRSVFRKPGELPGTGPYIWTIHERKHRIVMRRNPDFREDYYPSQGAPGDRKKGLLIDAGKRVPFIDVLDYTYVLEDYSAWMSFLSGLTDASGIPRETFRNVVNPQKELSDKWRKKHIYLRKYTQPGIYWIAFNMEDPVIGASKSLRQALCLCFDVENYINVLYNGRGKRAVNIFPSFFDAHEATGPGPYYRLDISAANKKLEQARKELAAAGQLVEGGLPTLELDLPGRDAAVQRMGEFVRQQFDKLGLNIKVNYNDWPTQQQKVNNKQVQMYAMGWVADYPDGQNFLQLFYSPNIDKGTNNMNYSNPRFDELYEKASVMPPGPERIRLYAQMGRMVNEDCPALLLSEAVTYVLYRDWVKNVKRHPIGSGYSKYIRIDTELRRKHNVWRR